MNWAGERPAKTAFITLPVIVPRDAHSQTRRHLLVDDIVGAPLFARLISDSTPSPTVVKWVLTRARRERDGGIG
jgi:hypothetical protein